MSAREPSTQQFIRRGIVATAVLAAVVTLVAVNPFARGDDTAEFSIVAPAMPDGVQKGTPVDMRGETVGEVCNVDNSQAGSTRIGLCIKTTAMGALTPDTAASFVSRNLFGSDALRLIPAPGQGRLAAGQGGSVDQGADGVAAAGAGAVGALETIIANRLLEDTVYTGKVATMIADIGGLFTDLGSLFNGMSGLGATMDLMTAFTTPLTHSLQGSLPGRSTS